jgi:glycosyltransferase involved in cell wall biosynthesis
MLGGGERYLLTIASLFSATQSTSLVIDPSVLKRIFTTFGLQVENTIIIHPYEFLSLNTLNRFRYLRKFDAFFYTTDGSVFFSSSKKNYLVIQSPAHIPVATIFNRIKLSNWESLCYSSFMRDIIQKRLSRNSLIIPPAIDNIFFDQKRAKKRNIILTVGRFFPHPHNKRQEVLIEVFKSFAKRALSGWKLVVVGGLTEEGGNKVVGQLKKLSEGSAVEIKVNVGFKELLELYRESKVYWHAAGFGEDLETNPERAEHFGITTLEAMASGCVPIIFPAGGQVELVQDGENGYYWKTPQELIEKTALLSQDDKLTQSVARRAKESARLYSLDNLKTSYEKLLE